LLVIFITNALSVPYCSLETAADTTTTGIGSPVVNESEFVHNLCTIIVLQDYSLTPTN